MQPDRPDIFSWLLEEFEGSPSTDPQKKLDLEGDAYLIVVAGRYVAFGNLVSPFRADGNSDTTATTLTSLFFQLAMDPQQVLKLRQEISEAFPDMTKIDSVSLSKLKHLNAVINETLRLHPPVPSGLQRITPAEGIRVGDTFIPGNTIVQIPMHSIFRGKHISYCIRFEADSPKITAYSVGRLNSYPRGGLLVQNWSKIAQALFPSQSVCLCHIKRLFFVC